MNVSGEAVGKLARFYRVGSCHYSLPPQELRTHQLGLPLFPC